jgi:hypothetical protein
LRIQCYGGELGFQHLNRLWGHDPFYNPCFLDGIRGKKIDCDTQSCGVGWMGFAGTRDDDCIHTLFVVVALSLVCICTCV